MTRVFVRLIPAVMVVLLALLGPLLVPHDIDEPVTAQYGLPKSSSLLGGDQIGRDVLTRLLAGGRDLLLTSVLIAVVVTGLAAILGAVSALRPRLGLLIEHAADVLILLPAVLGILLIGVAWPESGRLPVVVAAVVLGTPFAFRIAAAAASSVATAGFVEVAVAGGEPTLSLVFREILPNLRATLLTLFGLRFVAAVHLVTTAGFLGIGSRPPAADWALMIRENANGTLLNPWAVLAPSIAIAILSVSVSTAFNVLTPKARNRVVTRL